MRLYVGREDLESVTRTCSQGLAKRQRKQKFTMRESAIRPSDVLTDSKKRVKMDAASGVSN
jgi:hypothetical protein